jgi:hypothetical protein
MVKQEPPTERYGALRDAPASIYVLGDFLPGARHLAFSMQIASWAQMPDSRKFNALIKSDRSL